MAVSGYNMPCFRPLYGYKSKTKNASGKRSIVFRIQDGFADMPVTVPCGRCIGCRLEKSRQWAIRCLHEASLHEKNCFITLTFDDKHLNEQRTLVKRDFVLFMKRLRKRFGKDIKFYHCGEYGEQYERPHHHACIFNFDFPDKVLLRDMDGVKLYISEELSKLWTFGYHTIGDVTFDSAAYVARYVTKKITGDMATEAYCDIDYTTGEILNERLPEYSSMSRRPGIGAEWYEKYKTSIYNFDRVIVKEHEVKPPKYYDRLFELENPSEFSSVKIDRKKKAAKSKDNTISRLLQREKVLKAKMKQKQRSFENEKSIHSLRLQERELQRAEDSKSKRRSAARVRLRNQRWKESISDTP